MGARRGPEERLAAAQQRLAGGRAPLGCLPGMALQAPGPAAGARADPSSPRSKVNRAMCVRQATGMYSGPMYSRSMPMLRPHIAAAGLQVLDPAGVRKRRDEPVTSLLGPQLPPPDNARNLIFGDEPKASTAFAGEIAQPGGQPREGPGGFGPAAAETWPGCPPEFAEAMPGPTGAPEAEGSWPGCPPEFAPHASEEFVPRRRVRIEEPRTESFDAGMTRRTDAVPAPAPMAAAPWAAHEPEPTYVSRRSQAARALLDRAAEAARAMLAEHEGPARPVHEVRLPATRMETDILPGNMRQLGLQSRPAPFYVGRNGLR